MLRKLFLFALVLLSFLTIFAQQETEPASASAITEMKLPAGAVRVLSSSIPAEISSGLEQIVEAGKGKIIGGEREVLAWTRGNYRKGSAPNLVEQIEKNLKAKGWEYEAGEKESGVTFFSALRESPSRRAVLGFFIADNNGLILAWTEVLPADSSSQNKSETESQIENESIQNTSNNSVRNSGSLSNLAGKWERLPRE